MNNFKLNINSSKHDFVKIILILESFGPSFEFDNDIFNEKNLPFIIIKDSNDIILKKGLYSDEYFNISCKNLERVLTRNKYSFNIENLSNEEIKFSNIKLLNDFNSFRKVISNEIQKNLFIKVNMIPNKYHNEITRKVLIRISDISGAVSDTNYNRSIIYFYQTKYGLSKDPYILVKENIDEILKAIEDTLKLKKDGI